MKVLTIVGLAIASFYFLTVQLGILTFLCWLGVGALIAGDRNSASIETFFAACFGLSLIGIVLMSISAL